MIDNSKRNPCPACNKEGSRPSVNKAGDVLSCTTRGCRVLRYI